MPNYVANQVYFNGDIKDITALSEEIFKKGEEGELTFSFNTLLPMPKSLNVASTSDIKYYVKAYLNSLPRDESENFKEQLKKIYKDKGSVFGYMSYYDELKLNDCTIEEDAISRLNSAFKEEYADFNVNAIEEVGKIYLENILYYHTSDWYDWCVENWGTKWDAVEVHFSYGNTGIYFETAWSPPIPIFKKLAEIAKKHNVDFYVIWADEDVGEAPGKLSSAKISENDIYEPISDSELYGGYFEPGSSMALKIYCEAWGYDPEDSEYIEVDPDTGEYKLVELEY